jgi:hypothetical protein
MQWRLRLEWREQDHLMSMSQLGSLEQGHVCTLLGNRAERRGEAHEHVIPQRLSAF